MSFDLLLAGFSDPERTLLADALRAVPGVRLKEVCSGRDAVTSLNRATFSGLVCPLDLGDLRASQLVGMIRRGVSGYPRTPVIVLTDAPEMRAMAAAGDSQTFYLNAQHPDSFAAQVIRLLTSNPKSRVLLVEDDPAHADVSATELSKYYEVEVARDGDAGLDAWCARRHDVVLLDLMLPGMSGEEVQRNILTLSPTQPIVILTANAEPEKHQSMVLAGAAAFLSKPIDLRIAAATIDAVLKDQQCDTLTQYARGTEDNFQSVATRVHVAYYNLERGQAANAHHHLQQALNICSVRGPTDDEWATLLSEVDQSHSALK